MGWAPVLPPPKLSYATTSLSVPDQRCRRALTERGGRSVAQEEMWQFDDSSHFIEVEALREVGRILFHEVLDQELLRGGKKPVRLFCYTHTCR
jgi:hypothetical protein